MKRRKWHAKTNATIVLEASRAGRWPSSVPRIASVKPSITGGATNCRRTRPRSSSPPAAWSRGIWARKQAGMPYSVGRFRNHGMVERQELRDRVVVGFRDVRPSWFATNVMVFTREG